MPDISFEKIAREALIDLRSKAFGISNYGCVTGTGHIKDATLNQACHAFCSGFVQDNRGVILYSITTGLSAKSLVPQDIAEKYFAWLCSAESPWADCLHNGLNDDPKFVAEYGVLIKDLDKLGRNLIGGALTASRACFEHSSSVLMWAKLVTDGLDPRWAFFLCGYTTLTSNNCVVYGLRGNQNHWPLHPWAASEQYIRNFLTQSVQFDDIPFSSSIIGGGRIGGVWGPYGMDSRSIPARVCTSYGVSEYWVKFKFQAGYNSDPSNTFNSNVVSSSYEDFFKTALREQERLYA